MTLCKLARTLSTRVRRSVTASGIKRQSLPELKSTKLSGRPIYLDYQATTPLDPRVLDAMLPLLTEQFGNPHSRTHYYGWEAEGLVDKARDHIAGLIGADAKEVVFTSGATESNNMAIKGIAGFYGKNMEVDGTSTAGSTSARTKPHIITTQTEHKCVLDSCRQLEEDGLATVTYLPVMKSGLVDLDDLQHAIKPETVLVSIMMVNNEIGVIQPIKEIGVMLNELNQTRQNRIFFHSDAAQAAGKLPIDLKELNVDLLSISGHKLYGPKGIGALYIRRRPRVRLAPIMSGGGQERGFRSGTVPAPLAVGLGEACRIAQNEMTSDHKHITRLSQHLLYKLNEQIPQITRNGDPDNSYPGCLNVSFGCVEGESLLMALKKMALSSGSACTSASLEPSYVLRALGCAEDLAHSSIRFGIGRFTTQAEVDLCIEETVKQVQRLRELSPLWEMIQEGIDLDSIKWSQH